MRLRTKIIGLLALTLGGTLSVLTVYDRTVDAELVRETRRAAESLTKALQVSVQQLGASTQPDEGILKNYVQRLGRAGIREITVLNPDKEEVQSAHAYLIEEQQKDRPANARSTYALLVPIVVGADKLGYVELKMTSADFEDRLAELRLERAQVSLAAFALALVVAVMIARQLTRPMEGLRTAAVRIGKGDLAVDLPTPGSDEVGSLVEAFGGMLLGLRERAELRRKLESAEREAALGRLAARVAHDIRNPLNYLSLAVDHLLAQEAKPESLKIGAQIKGELARADSRVAELLRLGKPVVIHPEELSARALLDSVAGSMSTPAHPIEVKCEELGRVAWDPTVVDQILRNLVTNAIQASPDGRAIELRAEAADDDAIAVHVEDRGSGLDPTVKEHLFEAWFTTKTEGIGLGLMLARKSAHEHGGELSADDREGGGARFTLLLPRDGRRPA